MPPHSPARPAAPTRTDAPSPTRTIAGTGSARRERRHTDTAPPPCGLRLRPATLARLRAIARLAALVDPTGRALVGDRTGRRETTDAVLDRLLGPELDRLTALALAAGLDPAAFIGAAHTEPLRAGASAPRRGWAMGALAVD